MWKIAGIAGLLVLVTGVLPLDDAHAVLDRVAPILLFLAAVTIVAELADAAGVFDVAAQVAAGLGRGRVLVLWLLVVVLATVTTIVLSLDTTAVLLTPVVLALAVQLDLPPLPFAMTTVWLANTASLLLPVSNLTNLLAVDRLNWSATTYARHTWLAALVAVVVTVVVLYVLHRRDLSGRYVAPAREPVADRLTFWLAAAVCVLLAVLFVVGVPYWAAASVGALVLVAGFTWRSPGCCAAFGPSSHYRSSSRPWGCSSWCKQRRSTVCRGCSVTPSAREVRAMSTCSASLASALAVPNVVRSNLPATWRSVSLLALALLALVGTNLGRAITRLWPHCSGENAAGRASTCLVARLQELALVPSCSRRDRRPRHHELTEPTARGVGSGEGRWLYVRGWRRGPRRGHGREGPGAEAPPPVDRPRPAPRSARHEDFTGSHGSDDDVRRA